MGGFSGLIGSIERLADDIKSSAEGRQVKISELKSDAHNLLERFRLEHQDMSDAVKEKLPSDEAARREADQQFMSGVRLDVGAKRESILEFIDDVRSDVAGSKEATQQFMIDVIKPAVIGIRTNVAGDMEANRHFIIGVKSDVESELKRFDSERQDMADALKEKLSSDEAARREADQQFVSDVKSDVAANKEATQQFMSDVKSDVADDKEATQQFMSDVKSDVEAGKDATQQSIDELASDRREFQEAWRKNFGGAAAEPAPEPVAEKVAVEEPIAEEIVEEEPVAEEVAVEEPVALSPEDQILEVVAEHPEGIRLVDIGNELGVDWRGLIGSIKPLVDEDRVEKIDNLYYPKS